MAMRILRLPILRFYGGCSSSSSSTSFLSMSPNTIPLPSVRWVKSRIYCPVRSFASVKSAKMQPQKKSVLMFSGEKDWMKFVLKDFSNTAERTSNHGYYKAKYLLMEKGSIKLELLSLIKLLWRSWLKSQNIGGHKLEAAIEQLGIDVVGKVALDSGLSTGGFTDCLLQYGASVVYGVDVGYGQVADKIRRDERVSVIERTNLRYLSELPQNQKVDLVTLDLSFISILLVMPAVVNLMKKEATLVTLIKPQFEARRSQVGGGGIVRDTAVHQEVLEKIINGVESFGFKCQGSIESPLKGAEGNTEFLACFTRTAEINADSARTVAETSIDSGSETLA